VFNPGDKVYVWEKSSKESLVDNLGSPDIIRLPQKWINPWSGPFDFLRWISERKCMIDYYGTPTEYHVNRLTKHHSWDNVNPDTNEWCLRNRKRGDGEVAQADAPAVFSESDPVPIPPGFALLPGEIFVFPMEVDGENSMPFGMGRVLSHTPGQFIEFQWMSNYNQSYKAKFQPMWFQNSEKKAYYKAKPIHASHPPYTGKDLAVFVKSEDVILLSRDKPFLEEGILIPWARKFIFKNELVAQSMRDFQAKQLRIE
jgi:hypothetical protein